MSLNKQKLQVLNILFDNLKECPPQLVPSSQIAGQLNLSMTNLKKILKHMENIGFIQTDMDQQYNLITQKGLHMYREHNYTS